MELNKENQHIVMQWNDSLLPLITAFLVCFRKKLFQRMVAINIHDRLSSEATGLDVFVLVACHIAKGGLLNVIGKEIILKQITELKASISDDNMLKGHRLYRSFW
jgi:S-adenosylmethionine hydrolase